MTANYINFSGHALSKLERSLFINGCYVLRNGRFPLPSWEKSSVCCRYVGLQEGKEPTLSPPYSPDINDFTNQGEETWRRRHSFCTGTSLKSLFRLERVLTSSQLVAAQPALKELCRMCRPQLPTSTIFFASLGLYVFCRSEKSFQFTLWPSFEICMRLWKLTSVHTDSIFSWIWSAVWCSMKEERKCLVCAQLSCQCLKWTNRHLFISRFKRLPNKSTCPDSFFILSFISGKTWGIMPNVPRYVAFFSPQVNCFVMSLSGNMVWKKLQCSHMTCRSNDS